MVYQYKLNSDEFISKKIIFFGPADTNDKININLNDYDFIIITNNTISFFFEKYSIDSNVKIIGLFNRLYSSNYIDIIIKYNKYIYLYIFPENFKKSLLEFFCERTNVSKNKIILSKFHLNNKIPLGLSRILNLFENIKFEKLYITGVTFYNEENIEKCYDNSNYMIKEAKKYNIFNADKNIHNIKDNIEYTKIICKNNKNIILCYDLEKILYKLRCK